MMVNPRNKQRNNVFMIFYKKQSRSVSKIHAVIVKFAATVCGLRKEDAITDTQKNFLPLSRDF